MDQIISYLPKVSRAGKPDEISIEDFSDILGRKYLSRKLKKNLPATIVAALFEGGREIKHIRAFTGFMDIDIDQHDNEELELKNIMLPVLINDPYFMHLRVSAGGEGIKAIVKIPVVKSVVEYKARHHAFRDYMKTTYGIKVDKACDDPTRCAFVNYDKNPYFNDSSKPYMERIAMLISDEDLNSIDIHGANGVSSVASSPVAHERSIVVVDDELIEITDFLSGSPELYDTHQEWFKLGCAIKSKYGDAGLPYYQRLTAAGDTTSNLGKKYTPEYVAQEYARFRESGGITFSTVVKMCNDAGWDINESPVIRMSSNKKAEIVNQLLIDTLIGLDEVIEKPIALVEWNDIPVMTLENISVIIGKAKSMKSSFISGLVVGQILNEKETTINGHFPLGRRGVVIIDTEQTRYHASLAIIHAKSVAEENNIPLYVHSIRELNTEKRVSLVEAAIIHYADKASLFIIDGIRDLVRSINNEDEATTIVNKLMELSSKYKFHISAVLHQNKGDDFARGHIGTEMVNKAETVVLVEAIKDRAGKANISITYSRGMDPGDLQMERTEDTIKIIDHIKEPSSGMTKKATSKYQEAVEALSHSYLVDYIFTHVDENTMPKLVFSKHLTGALGIPRRMGDKLLDHLISLGWVKMIRIGNSKNVELCDIKL